MTELEIAEIAEAVTRFWRSVIRGLSNECWYWAGYTENGYGKFNFQGRMRWAHEMALTFTTGEVKTPGMDTCHSRECLDRLCCNPSHLRFDTRQSNVDDMVATRGPNRTWKKLSPELVKTIRVRLANGATGAELAKQYGVSTGMVSMINTGKRCA